MKKEISPILAAVVIVAAIGLAAFGWVRMGGVSKQKGPPPTMPAAVAKQWSEYTQGAPAGPGAAAPVGTTGSIPGGGTRASGPPMMGQGPNSPPIGPGGRTMPIGPGGAYVPGR